MKSITENSEEQGEKYLQILKNILDAVKKGVNNFDIFAELVSSMVWQSPKGLAVKWIEKVASDDWNSLQETIDDTLAIKQLKHLTRKQVISGCSQLVYLLAKNPTFLQKMTTRLAIRDTLASNLELHDQDRLIATELGLPYRKWKQLLGALSHVELPEGVTEMNSSPIIQLDDTGSLSSEIVFDGHVEWGNDQLSGVEMDHGVGEYGIGIGPILAFFRQPVSIITLSDTVMLRFDTILGTPEQEGKIRNMVLETMSGLPAWKKRSFSGNKPEKKEAPNLNPVWNPTI